MMKLKQKLTLGLAFLFIAILSLGILSIFYINRLGSDADNVIRNNHETLMYCNNILKELDNVKKKKDALAKIESNLHLQEGNITEQGEKEATDDLRRNFEELKQNPQDSTNYTSMRQAIYRIQELNQYAIVRKNAVARKTAENATFWLTLIFSIMALVTFTFVMNFPGILSDPINALRDGISEIANKNYGKRIYLKQADEFGDLANAFNSMAEKLDEYENSNLNRILLEKKRIEIIINQMRDAIIGLDDRKNVLFMNAVAENLLELKEKDVAGKYAADIALRNDLMRTLLQENGAKELKIFADGKESYFFRENTFIKNGDVLIGEVIVLRNITPFHELDEAKTNFIATVSHELKTPISSIKMSASLLNDNRVGSLNGEQQELTNSIYDDADRLLKITGELLNMAQVETGNIQLKLQSTSPAFILGQAIQAVQFQALQKKITLTQAVKENLPPVLADPEKTSWVLINFLTNAIKFSPEQSAIEVSVSEQGKKILFSVKDVGRGIDEKYLPRIFDRYFKVPGMQDRSGTGLGLAISKEFIEAEGGTIHAESRIGEGSIFSFELNKTR
jgi:signal transduction histidine kinase